MVLSCLLGGKARTRWAVEVGEEEEVTGAVIFLNWASYLAEAVQEGFYSGTLAKLYVGSTVPHCRKYCLIASSYLVK